MGGVDVFVCLLNCSIPCPVYSMRFSVGSPEAVIQQSLHAGGSDALRRTFCYNWVTKYVQENNRYRF